MRTAEGRSAPFPAWAGQAAAFARLAGCLPRSHRDGAAMPAAAAPHAGSRPAALQRGITQARTCVPTRQTSFAWLTTSSRARVRARASSTSSMT